MDRSVISPIVVEAWKRQALLCPPPPPSRATSSSPPRHGRRRRRAVHHRAPKALVIIFLHSWPGDGLPPLLSSQASRSRHCWCGLRCPEDHRTCVLFLIDVRLLWWFIGWIAVWFCVWFVWQRRWMILSASSEATRGAVLREGTWWMRYSCPWLKVWVFGFLILMASVMIHLGTVFLFFYGFYSCVLRLWCTAFILFYTFRFCCHDFSGAKNNQCVNKTATLWCLYWELPG